MVDVTRRALKGCGWAPKLLKLKFPKALGVAQAWGITCAVECARAHTEYFGTPG